MLNLGRKNPSTISSMNVDGWMSWIALTVVAHRLRESSSPMLLPPIDQGWHGGPATRRSAFRRCDRSRFSSRSLMMLLNPLSLSVATHLSLDSTRARWWNPSDLAAWARPPHPENRSTTVLVGGSAALLLLLWSVSVFTPSKRAVRLSVVGCTSSSGCGGSWVVVGGGTAGGSCGLGGFTPSCGCSGG